MNNTIRKSLWCSVLCGSMASLMASPPIIGVARSWGAFLINDASVPGSATLLDGTSLTTVDASSNLNLSGGERVTMSSNSSATIHRDYFLLERGTAEFTGTAAYRIAARNFRVAPLDSSAHIRVGLASKDRVLVASAGGEADVRNSRGVLIAHVLSGAGVTLSATSSAAVELTGLLQSEAGKFYLTDSVTKVKVELRGSNLAKLVGKQVHVVGTESGEVVSAGAPQIVAVTTVTPVAAGAAGAGGAAAGAGVASSFPTIAVIGGAIAVGGVVGGLAATGVIGGGASVSR